MSRNRREGRYCGRHEGAHRRHKHWTYWLIANRIWAQRTNNNEGD